MKEITIRLFRESDRRAWDEYVYKHPDAYHAHLIGWKDVIEQTYNKKSYYLVVEDSNQIVGILPLFHIKSILFGNQLVSMPYLTYGGVLADRDEIARTLIERALEISKELNTDYLELRQVQPLNGKIYEPEKTQINTSKVSMRLALPETSEELFKAFRAKLRSQIRRPKKEGMIFKQGGSELIEDFYRVFVVNMRDLGSPVHSKKLFYYLFKVFPNSIKSAVVYSDGKAVAAGIITLFNHFVEIPWASSIKAFNRFSPNMLLYWGLLEFVTNKGFKVFDYGRSEYGESTYKFKEQWGSYPQELNWYSLLQDSAINNEVKKEFFVHVWSKLPVSITKIAGPLLRKGISL